MILMFLGAPGAGKGTRADIASRMLGIPTVSTGEIIREAIRNKTPLGLEAEKAMADGGLVPDELVIEIVKGRISLPDCAGGYILDGFPRTVSQAEALQKMGIVIDLVISVEASDDLIVERLCGRQICPKCGTTYHTVDLPSKDGKTCDKCGTALAVRKDDNPEIVRKRLGVYHKQSEPLKDFYKKLGHYVEIDGTKGIETATAQLSVLLREKI